MGRKFKTIEASLFYVQHTKSMQEFLTRDLKMI